MKIVSDFIFKRLRGKLLSKPDQEIGNSLNGVYLKRWFLIPKNKLFNVYLHEFLRSDDDRALHDHPWANASLILRGCYQEWLPRPDGSGLMSRMLHEGDFKLRLSGKFTHRIQLVTTDQTVVTLFITGPKYREWGFHCPKGWKHWKDFTDDSGDGVGKGCAD